MRVGKFFILLGYVIAISGCTCGMTTQTISVLQNSGSTEVPNEVESTNHHSVPTSSRTEAGNANNTDTGNEIVPTTASPGSAAEEVNNASVDQLSDSMSGVETPSPNGADDVYAAPGDVVKPSKQSKAEELTPATAVGLSGSGNTIDLAGEGAGIDVGDVAGGLPVGGDMAHGGMNSGIAIPVPSAINVVPPISNDVKVVPSASSTNQLGDGATSSEPKSIQKSKLKPTRNRNQARRSN